MTLIPSLSNRLKSCSEESQSVIKVLSRLAGQILTIESKPIFSLGYKPMVNLELSIKALKKTYIRRTLYR